MVRRKTVERPKSESNGEVAISTDQPPEIEEDAGWYTIRPWIEAPVGTDHDPDADFVEDVMGSIVYHRPHGARQRAGRFRVYQVRLSDAWEAGWSPWDVLGAHSDALTRYCHPLFDPKTGEFHESLADDLHLLGGKLVALDCIEILPSHRGKGLGLAVASKLIDILTCAPHALVVCCPIPVQFRPTYGDGQWPDERFCAAMRMDRFTRSVPRAIGKLRRYFGKLGFQRVAKTDVYALSTSLVRPKLDDICDASVF